MNNNDQVCVQLNRLGLKCTKAKDVEEILTSNNKNPARDRLKRETIIYCISFGIQGWEMHKTDVIKYNYHYCHLFTAVTSFWLKAVSLASLSTSHLLFFSDYLWSQSASPPPPLSLIILTSPVGSRLDQASLIPGLLSVSGAAAVTT